jgi:hypothetical protein
MSYSEKKEIRTIITDKLHHYFYSANLFLFYVFIMWFMITKYQSEKIAIMICFFSIIASILYSVSYYRIKKIYISSSFNLLGFSASISLLLAMSNVLVIISFIFALELGGSLASESVDFFSILIHTLFFGLSITALVFCSDYFYVFYVLIFQIGILVENKFSREGNNLFTFIYVILTIICFIFSLIYNKNVNTEQEIVDLYALEKKNLEY